METVVTTEKEPTLVEQMDIIPFFSPAMQKRPADYNFETDGLDYAAQLKAALHQKMVEYGIFGLSANQVGIDRRVFVMGTPDICNVFFNPTVVGVTKEKSVHEEACITLPNFSVSLLRPEGVHITYQDETGEMKSSFFTGISARIIQHEYDYMQGRNFTQLASNFKLKHELKKYKNKQKKTLLRIARSTTTPKNNV